MSQYRCCCSFLQQEPLIIYQDTISLSLSFGHARIKCYPDFGWFATTARLAAQFTLQFRLFKTWMLFIMATFEFLEFNNDKRLNTHNNFHFLKSFSHTHSLAHSHTHTLKWVNWWWTEVRPSLVMCTVSNLVNTVLSLTHINLITEWCWAQGSAWGQTGLNAHWRTFSLGKKVKTASEME